MGADRARGRASPVLEKRDSQPSIDDKVGEEAKKPRRIFLDKMDAIAYGVQAQFEEKTGYSRRVTETTMNVARVLGIPEAEIERWASSRLAQLIRDTERLGEIKSLLERLQGSFVEQTDNKRH